MSRWKGAINMRLSSWNGQHERIEVVEMENVDDAMMTARRWRVAGLRNKVIFVRKRCA